MQILDRQLDSHNSLTLHPFLQSITFTVSGSRFPSLLKYTKLKGVRIITTFFANIIFHPIFHAVV